MSRSFFNFGKLVFIFFSIVILFESSYSQVIEDIIVRGNGRVEKTAIVSLLESKKGTNLNPASIKKDILALYNLKFFSDIRILQQKQGTGIALIIEVKEKPAIVKIEFIGLDEVNEKDFKDKIDSKIFSIVNEATITSDIRKIEKTYLEKGFYLANCNYKLVPTENGSHEVNLQFIVSEGGKVHVGNVHIIGNKFFTKTDIIDKFIAKPMTRSTAYSTPGSLYNDEFILRDQSVLGYIYKDKGFAEVKTSKPVGIIDSDREFVRLTYEVEEGLQYDVGKIDIVGDLLYPKEEMINDFLLKTNKIFRISQFQRDIEYLVDKYGDKGYAFVDVNPIPNFDREKQTVDLTFSITKGEKVYFGEISVIGNIKTRDNVIRREFQIADSELYSGTGLTNSRNNVTRLGYFDQVKAIRERDPDNPSVLNYKFQVKEKPTGQLQAALGFSPGSTSESSWFGQGTYAEQNQSGRGWKTNLSVRWNGENNYNFSLGFTEPRINDSHWSLGFSVFYKNEISQIIQDTNVQNRRYGGDVTLGKKLIEKIHGSLTYELSIDSLGSKTPIDEKYKSDGLASSMIFSLFRNSVDNNLDPSEGTKVRGSHKFTGGLLSGDQHYMESSLRGDGYIPIDFSETYRTYFHLYSHVKYLSTLNNKEIPFIERYRLGGPRDLRAYSLDSIGHKKQDVYDTGSSRLITVGGDKEFLFQFEYFFPIIKEANIKGLLFTDMGNTYFESEELDLGNLKKDFGFGFRWITPVAPFRFEWAYPYDQGNIGEPEFIFYLGY